MTDWSRLFKNSIKPEKIKNWSRLFGNSINLEKMTNWPRLFRSSIKPEKMTKKKYLVVECWRKSRIKKIVRIKRVFLKGLVGSLVRRKVWCYILIVMNIHINKLSPEILATIFQFVRNGFDEEGGRLFFK